MSLFALEAGATILDLMDVTNYLVEEDDADLGEPDEVKNRRTVTLKVLVRGVDADGVATNLTALQRLLNRAAMTAGPVPVGSRPRLRYQPGTAPVWFEILRGRVTADPQALTMIGLGYARHVTLTLECLAYAVGEPLAVQVTSGTGAGTASSWRLPDPGGDAPALLNLTLYDRSGTTAVVQGWSVGARAVYDSVDADYVPFAPVTSAGSLVAVGGGIGLGTVYASGTATTSGWTALGTVTQPGSAQYDVGAFDVYGLVRDATVIVDAPSGPAVDASGFTIEQHNVGLTFGDNIDNNGTVTWPRPTTPGNTLLLYAACNNPGIVASAITPPDGWIFINQQSTGSNHYSTLWYWPDAPSRSGNEVLASSGGYFPPTVSILVEISGLKAKPLDQFTGNTGSGVAVSTGTTGTTDQDYEIAIVGWSWKKETAPSAPTNYTWIASDYIQTDGTGPGGGLFFRERTSKATQSASAAGAIGIAYSAIIATFRAVTSARGTMSTGNYRAWIAALSSGSVESPAVGPLEWHLHQPGGAALVWQPPDNSPTPVSQYRVYYQFNDGGTVRLDTGSTATAYELVTSSSTAGTPVLVASNRAQLRLGLGLSSGSVYRYLPAVSTKVAGNSWEWLKLGSRVTLPPAAALQGGTASPWAARAEAGHPQTATRVDFGGLALMPSPPESARLLLRYVATDGTSALGANRAWQYDGRNDGWASGILRAFSTVALTPSGTVTANGDGTVSLTGSTSRVELPSSVLSASQGWIAQRVTLPHATTTDSALLHWGDDGNNLFYLYWQASGSKWQMARVKAGVYDDFDLADTLADGATALIIFAWTATTVRHAVDGGAFATKAGSNAPTLATSIIRLGGDSVSGGNNLFGAAPKSLEGSYHWVMAGTGTLTDADSAALWALGDDTPNAGTLGSAAGVTLLWTAAKTNIAFSGPPTEAGHVEPRGQLVVGPGATELVVLPHVAAPRDLSAIQADTRVQWDGEAIITPRYRLIGAP